MRRFKEVQAVGLTDWFWFVIWLKRDEFSYKLDLYRYYPDLDRLVRDRKRAHRIDAALNSIA